MEGDTRRAMDNHRPRRAERFGACSIDMGYVLRTRVSDPNLERSSELDCMLCDDEWDWRCRRPGADWKWTLRAAECDAERGPWGLWTEGVPSVSPGDPDCSSACGSESIFQYIVGFVADELGGTVPPPEHILELE